MTIEEIIFDSPLYSRWKNTFSYEEDGQTKYNTLDYEIQQFDERVELYCTECESKRMFAADKGVYRDARIVTSHHYPNEKIKNKPSLYKSFRCSASSEHSVLYGFIVVGEDLVKIAEFPSKYDSVKDTLNEYKKVIPKEKLTELAKAAQLESYGYAIGSFLYYRRIFETIILQAFIDGNFKDKITEKEFRGLRMEDKIDYVKEHLPDYFNENAHMYSTLSKGVHELEENECREYLPIVKTIIFFALDEAVDKRKKELRKKEFSDKLKQINTKLK